MNPVHPPSTLLDWGIYNYIYCQTSNISRTKSQNLNVSILVLQLSLPHPFKPGVESRIKMYHYTWVVNNFIAYLGATYIRGTTVIKAMVFLPVVVDQPSARKPQTWVDIIHSQWGPAEHKCWCSMWNQVLHHPATKPSGCYGCETVGRGRRHGHGHQSSNSSKPSAMKEKNIKR